MTDLHELWLAWEASGGGRRERDALITACQSLADMIARSYARSRPAAVEELPVEDMASVALLGIIKSIDRFDLNEGVKFQTFAQHRAKGAILDELRREDSLPSATRRQVTRLAREEERLTQALGRVPTDGELAGGIYASEADVRRLRRAEASALTEVELDDEDGHHDHDHNGVVDFRVLRDRLLSAFDVLEDAERVVMVLYYIEDLSMSQIGAILGISKAMVSKMRDRAMATVLEELRS